MEYSWIIFALLSAITAALVAIFGKIGLQSLDVGLATAVRAIIMSLFLVGIVAIQGKLQQINALFSDHKAIFYIVISGIAGALSWLFYFVALKNAKVFQVVSIDRLSVIFAIILAFFILGERITFKAGIGAALIVAGGIIIALE